MKAKAPSIDRLKELLSYDPESGEFTRTVDQGRQRAGCIAGSIDPINGYIRIGIDKVCHKAHRLAWLYMTGQWPPDVIDHINGDRSDNRFSNLRLAVVSENNQNVQAARKDSRSGYRGVSWLKARGKWRATINVDGKQHHLGYFDSPESASEAYLTAKSELHQFWVPAERIDR